MKRAISPRGLVRLKPVPHALLLALGVMTTSSAFAQSGDAPCSELQNLVQQASGELRQRFSDAPKVASGNDAQACGDYLANIETAGGLAVNGSDQTSETLQIDQEATIEGEVQVKLPDPEITIERDPANVSVTTVQPDVTIDQGQPTVTVKQAKPIITVELSQPKIKIEQPAPEITITMPDPGVDIATRQPKVDVNIPEPRVTVKQGEPSLNVDLAAQAANDEQSSNDDSTQRSDSNGMMTVEKTGLASESVQPEVSFNRDGKEAKVDVKGAEPKVAFKAAKPDVQFSMVGGKPEIEIVDSGAPKVTVQNSSGEQSTQSGSNGGSNAQQNLAANDASGAPAPDSSRALADATNAPKNAEGMKIEVSKLASMPVVNDEGTELGSVDRVVRNGGDAFVIMKHGGWLFGLNGKEVAMPVGETFIREERILLRDMTEEQIKSLPEYSYADETVLGNAEVVEVMQAR